MITKEQYLQAKKTIADYELQEWLFGNSELLKEPARGKTLIEESKKNGFANGAIVVTPDDTRYILDSDPYMTDCGHLEAKAFNTGTAISTDLIIWNEAEGWLVRQEDKPAGHIGPDVIRKAKEEAAARGYVKGAKVGGETLTGTLVDMLTYGGRYVIHGRTESGGTVFIHDMRDNNWAELDHRKTILEEAKERGYKNGAKVWFKDGSTMNLVGNPWMDDSKLLCGAIGYIGVTTSKITLWTPKDGWVVSLSDPKSPLQDAMDRGYKKGAVVKAGTEWTLTSDPYMKDGEVRCQSWLDGVESPVTIRIVNKEGEYTVKLIKAP